MVNLDSFLIELDVRNGQPTELRDSQPRVKENEDRIVVPAEMLIFLDKFQKFTLLLSGNCFSGDRIVHDHRCQFKSKWILTDQVIVNRQLKSRSQNTSDGVNGAVPSAIHLLKLDQPRLCIGQANLVNALLSKRFFVQDIDHGLISCTGVMAHSGFQRHILFYQFNYRIITAIGNDVVKQICLNLFFLLS